MAALEPTRFKASLPTLKGWIKSAGPQDNHPFVDVFGGNGRKYGIDMPRLVSWLEAQERAAEDEEARKRDAASQVSMQLGGGEVRGEHLVPADIRKKFYEAEIMGNRARKEREELVEAHLVEETDKKRMRFIATFLQGLPDFISRRVDIPTSVVAEISTAVDDFQDRLARHLIETSFLSADATLRVRRFIEGLEDDAISGGSGAAVPVHPATGLPDA